MWTSDGFLIFDALILLFVKDKVKFQNKLYSKRNKNRNVSKRTVGIWPNKDSKQPAHPRMLFGVFIVHLKEHCILWYPKCAGNHSDLLIWLFVGRTCPKVRVLTLRLECNFNGNVRYTTTRYLVYISAVQYILVQITMIMEVIKALTAMEGRLSLMCRLGKWFWTGT